MKWISPALVLMLGLAVILVSPPPAPLPDAVPGTIEPAVAVCPTEEGGGRATNLAVASTVAGEGNVTIFAGGATAGTGRFETGASGTVVVPTGTISAVGEAAGLVEFPAASSAVSALVLGSASMSAELCSRIPERVQVLGGANSLEGSDFNVQLMNPYATEAQVDITVFSESGREAAEALEGIIVPPRSSVHVDVGAALPGRQALSLSLETTRGSVLTSARLDIEGDSALWRPVAPGESWVLPAPGFAGGAREIVLVSTNASDVAYQVDVYGPGGVQEAFLDGVVEGRGQQVIDLNSLADGATAVRVVAEAPIGVFGRYSAPGGLAITSAAASSGPDWLLPGAGSVADATAAVVIVNVGLDVADVTVTLLSESSRTSVVSIPAGEAFEISLALSDGVSIESEGELVPVWFGRRAAAMTLSGGVITSGE